MNEAPRIGHKIFDWKVEKQPDGSYRTVRKHKFITEFKETDPEPFTSRVMAEESARTKNWEADREKEDEK